MRFSLLVMCGLVYFSSFGTEMDSLRTEERNGELFVLHQVDPGETLYAMSRRYGANVDDVIKVNQIENNNIQVGQILSIPIGKAQTTAATPTQQSSSSTHIVQPGETLFAVSRKYGISVDEIKRLNNLTSESLAVGQSLIVNSSVKSVPKATNEPSIPGGQKHYVQIGETLDQIASKRNVHVDSLLKWNKLPSDDLRIGQILWYKSYDRSSEPVVVKEAFGKKMEEGIAKQIEGLEDSDKYLALHKTLPPGTLLEVRNLMNNQKVFVRVVGQLPSTGLNENVIVRLTQKSFSRLGILDSRARVQITYYED